MGMAGTGTKPRQLDRADFVLRLRELIDEGLDHDTIIERMDPVRSMSVTEAFLRTAVKDIAAAVEIAHDVRNAAMVQANRDFVNFARHADDHDHVYSNTVAHIQRMYPVKDVGVRESKMKVAEAEQQRQRTLADQSAADWTAIQLRRATFDSAVQNYPQAFNDDEHKPWQPKPV